MIEKFEYRYDVTSPWNLNPIRSEAAWQWCVTITKYLRGERNLTVSTWIVYAELKDLIEKEIPPVL